MFKRQVDYLLKGCPGIAPGVIQECAPEPGEKKLTTTERGVENAQFLHDERVALVTGGIRTDPRFDLFEF